MVKPFVGGGGADVRRLDLDAIAAGVERLATERPGQEFLIQPMIDSIMAEGEWSFVYFDRALSYALLKKPPPGDYRSHAIYGGTLERVEPDRAGIEQAGAILEALPFDLPYARLDLVRIDGRLSVMEVELIEPILYLHLAPQGAAAQLVDACRARLGG